MSAVSFTFIVDEETDGVRLDVFLAEEDDPPLSRSQVKRCIEDGEISINAKLVTKAGTKLRLNDEVVWTHQPPKSTDLVAQDIPVEFLYEDEHLAVVNKPSGMVVHPSPGHPDGTLVNALLHHFDTMPVIGGTMRPGIVHRIDKDTSGALVVTKNDAAHRHLADLFRTHDIDRRYHALVYGPSLKDSGTFETLHGRDPNNRLRYTSRVRQGRHAITHFTVLERFRSGCALVECQLETGRTHQIRMHFAEHNAPLLGDPLYAGKAVSRSSIIRRQALHAYTLGFNHLDGSFVSCTAPYPDDFELAVERLRLGKDWR